jgi:hypothetical protein
MMPSFLIKLSYPLYSFVYDLEYSHVLVIFILYELAHSFYEMFIICSCLVFIVHMISLSRIKIRMVVHCSFRFSHTLARQSIGLES